MMQVYIIFIGGDVLIQEGKCPERGEKSEGKMSRGKCPYTIIIMYDVEIVHNLVNLDWYFSL